MHIIVDSFLLVFASEMGDKTQLLALILASRFRKPWVIMAGILTATLLNHGLASLLGNWVGHHISPDTLKIALSIIFVGFGIWILVPDKDEALKERKKHGAYLTTVIAFFLAEMGDKTQLATLALGARFEAPVLVTLGTTLGMIGADGIAVFLGDRFNDRIPMKWIRISSCILFIVFGVLIYLRGI